ncbi:MAG TPA: helix-turn-helix transcriptional regulator [Sphingomicrobium sp.]|jgi:transcriptional regulator with XRE-family HTH domain|nr:helix-turn-helix transcriptional regulator [Sphingomicrobium sp.]
MAAEIYTRLGAAIKAKRQGVGLSQAQLAQRLGLGRTSVTMIERGSQAVMVHQLVEIASALRCAPPELLTAAAHDPEFELQPAEIGDQEIQKLLIELGRPIRKITRT